ncbi:MAG: alanine dehydrogenase [Chloroflexota bacterium]
MNPPKTIGFPRMRQEPGEKRVFLPEFIQTIASLGVKVYVEEGYGSRSGYTFADYKRAHPNIYMCSREQAFQKDVVVILRSPKTDEFQLVKRSSTLISMLHYPTRPQRIERLKNLGINSISLDSIADDNSLRMVENMKAVAWNGLEAAFDWLERDWAGLVRPNKKPINVLVLGTGMVGKHAIEAATKLGNVERNNDHIASNGPGAVALSIGRNIASNPATMKSLMAQADILVDATQRRDASKPVVPNHWIGWLPKHAVVVDLAVDPYTLDADPPVVRGIEGIPQGSLNQYVFSANDSKWDQLVPEAIPSKHRRTTVTCYSWPGVHPEACMTHYAQQLEPFMEVLFEKGYDGLSPEGTYFERALYRATLKAWLDEEAVITTPIVNTSGTD